MTVNPMGLTQPCINCPFRKDKHFSLGSERRLQIATELREDKIFVCHKTVTYQDEDWESADTASDSRRMMCAGAIRTLLAERLITRPLSSGLLLGIWSPSQYPQVIPVFDSLTEWVSDGD